MRVAFLMLAALVVVAQTLDPPFPCTEPVNFIAPTFNVFRFHQSVSYHDSANFRTLFKETDTRWSLYDFTTGDFTTVDGDTCLWFHLDDAEISSLELAMSMNVTAILDDFNGYEAYTYEAPFGSLKFKGVIVDICVEHLTYIEIDGVPYTVAIYDDIQIDGEGETSVKDAVEYEIDEALKYVDDNQADCTPIDITDGSFGTYI